jgi:hypothetical protein
MKPYRTYDLGEASYLIASGYALMGVEGAPRAEFVFPAEAASIARAYYQGASAPALAMATTMRHLKGMLRRGV